MRPPQTCPCGWLVPQRWGIHVDFGEDEEEVVELPEGLEPDNDEMKLTVEMGCPQCDRTLVVEPDGVDVGRVGPDTVN